MEEISTNYCIIQSINQDPQIAQEIVNKLTSIFIQYAIQTSSSSKPKSKPTKKQEEKIEEKDHNVGIIIWYQTSPEEPVEILSGIETHYLTETFHPDKPHTQLLIQLLKQYETITFPVSSNKVANQIFKERAKIISEILQVPISFESIPSPPRLLLQQQTPQTHNNTNSSKIKYETHFRIIKSPTNPKYGIIKGKIEKGEKPVQAILRETEEELKFPLKLLKTHELKLLPSKKIHRFQNSILHTYHQEISEQEYQELKKWLEENKPEGEMMEFAFRPLQQINGHRKANAKSAEYIKTFRKQVFPEMIIEKT